MNRILKIAASCWKFFPILFIYCTLSAQITSPRPVSTAFAVLTKSIELKTASVNQELNLQTISEVVVNGRVVIPKGSSVIGHVAGLTPKGKGNQKSLLAIVIDKAVVDGTQEIPLQAIIAAVAAPQDNSLSSDPTYGMMHSNEPKMVASGPGGSVRTGDLSSSSKVSSTAAIATANITGAPDKSLLLKQDSQGAIGFANDLSLSWQLTIPPPVTVFSTRQNNLKLDAGTQVLLRMAQPSRAR